MAAIANVKVIESKIEVPVVASAQYRKVDREARVGDVIKFTDRDSSYLTLNGFYEVVELDFAGDPQIIDNSGDEYDLCGDDYEVYEKVTEPEPESDDLFTYKGVQYRKVKRKAAVGELCLRTRHFVKNPVGIVTKVAYIGAIEPVGEDNETLFPDYYVVLEPVKSAEPPKPTIKVGETVKLTIADGNSPKLGWGEVENGEIGTVRYVGKNSVRVDFPSQKNWDAAPGELTVLSEAAVEAEAERQKWAAIGRKVGELKVGDLTVLPSCPDYGFAEVVEVIGDRIRVKWASKCTTHLCNDGMKSHKLVVPVEQRFDRTEAVS